MEIELFCLCLFVYILDFANCQAGCSFEEHRGHALYGHNDKVSTGFTAAQCRDACLQEEEFVCKSFDYSPILSVCFLSSQTRDTKPEAYGKHEATNYFHKVCSDPSVNHEHVDDGVGGGDHYDGGEDVLDEEKDIDEYDDYWYHGPGGDNDYDYMYDDYIENLRYYEEWAEQESPECPGELQYYAGSCYRYVVYHDSTWEAASRYCEGQDPTSHLVHINSVAEFEHIQQQIYEAAPFPLSSNHHRELWWTGAIKRENQWVWMFNNGTSIPAHIDFWYPGEPNNAGYRENAANVLWMRQRWGLNDCWEEDRLRFICEYEKR